jgi:hypothetical protein
MRNVMIWYLYWDNNDGDDYNNNIYDDNNNNIYDDN